MTIPPTPVDLEQPGSMFAGGSILARLRSVMPRYRPLATATQQHYTEMQANTLLRAWHLDGPPVPVEQITSIPKVDTEHVPTLPVHGAATWIGRFWMISIDANDPRGQQRFTLAHEFKHVLDFRDFDTLHNGRPGIAADDHAESLADYFAMCLLMPQAWIHDAWHHGSPDADDLAARFEVTPPLADRRLWQLGLTLCGPTCRFSPLHIYRRATIPEGETP